MSYRGVLHRSSLYFLFKVGTNISPLSQILSNTPTSDIPLSPVYIRFRSIDSGCMHNFTTFLNYLAINVYYDLPLDTSVAEPQLFFTVPVPTLVSFFTIKKLKVSSNLL